MSLALRQDQWNPASRDTNARSIATSRHVNTHNIKAEKLNLRYQWLRGSIVMEGSSRSSRCAKASQSLVREYIKVIFIVSQALVYQQGECVIFSEVYVFTSVCLHAFAWMCLCSHRPLMLNWRAKWVSIPFQMFRQLLLELYSNRRSLQDDTARCRSLKSLQIWRNM